MKNVLTYRNDSAKVSQEATVIPRHNKLSE